jgi:hypothetical protein
MPIGGCWAWDGPGAATRVRAFDATCGGALGESVGLAVCSGGSYSCLSGTERACASGSPAGMDAGGTGHGRNGERQPPRSSIRSKPRRALPRPVSVVPAAAVLASKGWSQRPLLLSSDASHVEQGDSRRPFGPVAVVGRPVAGVDVMADSSKKQPRHGHGTRCSFWADTSSECKPEEALAPRVSRGKPAKDRRACLRPHPQQTSYSRRVSRPSSSLRVRSRSTSERATGRPRILAASSVSQSAGVPWKGMGLRTRLLAFGSAGALVIAGAICAAVMPDPISQLLTIVLMSLGFGGAVLLVFLEVGLSEDRERAREDRQRGGADSPSGRLGHERPPLRAWTPRSPRRPN